MINPQIALMGRQQDSFSALDNGLKMGQGLRQLVVGREIGNMNQIDDENERKAFADKSMFRRELNSQLKADASAKQKAMYDQLKTEAEIAKTASEAGKNNAQAGGFNLDNSGKLLTSANQALMVAARTGDPMAAKLALSNAFKAGAINQDVFDQYNGQIDVLGTNPEALKQFVGGITWANAKDPASLMYTSADNRLDNETSIANNRLTNQTSENNNIRTTDASRYSTDKTYETNEHRLNQDQNQFNTRQDFEEQKFRIQQHAGQSVIGADGNSYIFYPSLGKYEPALGPDGKQIMKKANGGRGDLPTSALKMVAGIQESIDIGDVSSQKIEKLTSLVDTANLGPMNNLISAGRNFAGISNEQSQAYERINAGINDAVNAILMAAKGVQTDGDATRAKAIILAAKSNDPVVVKNALEDLKDFNDEVKLRNQNRIGGVYANFGLTPNEYFGGSQAQQNTNQQQQQQQQSYKGTTTSLEDVKKAAAQSGLSVDEMFHLLQQQGVDIQ